MRRQCQLLGLGRSSLYYEPAAETAENLRLMRLLDQEYTAHPFLGSRRLTKWLSDQGEPVNRKRVLRVMREQRLIQRRRPSGRRRRPGHFTVSRPHQLWHLDMTSIWVAEHGWRNGGDEEREQAHVAFFRRRASAIKLMTPPSAIMAAPAKIK